jgi:hypothetical protein
MKLEGLRGAIIVAAGLSKDSRNVVFVKSIIDLLSESGLMTFDEDTAFPSRSAERGPGIGKAAPENLGAEEVVHNDSDTRINDAPIAPRGYIPTPFPLGPNRLAYLSLPGDWSTKELPKLLKMIELAFGDETK